jgi:NitT/TauT family transport system permease protein
VTRDRILLTLIVVGIWSALAYSGAVSPLFLPEPHAVVVSFWRGLSTAAIFRDIAATMARVLAGFVLGAAIGVTVGILLGYWKRLYNASTPFVDFLRSVPVTAILPLFLLAFGIGDAAKIAAIAWASALMMLINTVLGVASVPPTRIMVATTLRVSPHQRLLYVILPDALPQIFIGIRTAISFAVVVAVVSEMLLSTTDGIGASIYNSSMMYRTEDVYVGIFLTGAIGYILNWATARMDSRLVHWRAK